MKKRVAVGSGLLTTATLAGMLLATPASAMAYNHNDPSTLSFYIINDGHGFDPDTFSWELYQDSIGIFEGLVHPGPKGPVPGMATSWKVSKDGTTWTFSLRKNAKYSNGDPVTAGDFVFSMRRAVDPVTSVRETAGAAIIEDFPILNAADIRAGLKNPATLGVKALDDHTLQIKLAHPDPNLLRDMTLPSSGWIVPQDQKVVKTMFPRDWVNPSKIVSNGPYMLQSITGKTQAVLVPNPHYYGKVNLKQITLMYSAGVTGLLDYKNGALDVAELGGEDLVAAGADPNLKNNLHLYPSAAEYTLTVMPSQNTALSNPKVVKAFELAIDRNIICDNVLKGTAVPAYDFFGPTWLNPWIKDTAIQYNPTQAKKLLAEAGYPGGKGFPTVEMLTSGTDEVAQAIQQMWQQTLGVKVKYQGEEYGQYTQDMGKQLPADMVGFENTATNAKYASLMLPQSADQWLTRFPSLFWGYLPANVYNQFHANAQDQSMDPGVKMQKQAAVLEKNLPKDIVNLVNQGVQARASGNDAQTKKFFQTLSSSAYYISVYTPVQPLLIVPGLSGYEPQSLLLTVPPKWMNDITRN